MFKNVIVGVDGLEGGRDAIALAKVLRDAEGAMTLAHVHSGESHVWRGSSPAYAAAEESSSRELLERAADEAGIRAQLRGCGSPTVGRGLHELAEEVGADLLVVGSSRRGRARRVIIGDDARAALSRSPCAVAIAPARYGQREVRLRKVGVGYDGSPESRHAVEVARQLAGGFHSRLSVFEAVFVPTSYYTGAGFPALPDTEEMLRAARDRIIRLGVDIEPHPVYGRPAEELALYSASIDMLVIGSRSYGPLGRLVHGSTAMTLAQTVRCPLLVLTRGARAAGEQAETDRGSAAVASA